MRMQAWWDNGSNDSDQERRREIEVNRFASTLKIGKKLLSSWLKTAAAGNVRTYLEPRNECDHQ